VHTLISTVPPRHTVLSKSGFFKQHQPMVFLLPIVTTHDLNDSLSDIKLNATGACSQRVYKTQQLLRRLLSNELLLVRHYCFAATES
jgi:hypothetical protein